MVAESVRELVRTQFQELHERNRWRGDEEIVSFYPPGADNQRHLFGVAGTHVDGTTWSTGDCDVRFPLHSISKVFTYGLALEDNGRDAVLRRVGVEPSGEPFNSITFDDEDNRPHNPMINTGALVAASLVRGADRAEKVARILDRARVYTGNHDLQVDEEVLAQQLVSNDRNLGLSYLMRSLGMLTGDIEENLAVYLSACSISVTASELSVAGATLANGGLNPLTGVEALARGHVRDVVSVMLTCGMYDAAGEWTYDVGIPAKSGVSGGILATVPNFVGLGTFSPGLGENGNPVRGVNLCRDLSARFGLHVFADPAEFRLGRSSTPRRRRRVMSVKPRT